MATVTGLTEYQARLRALPERVQAVVLATLQSFVGDITGYMGTHAPWADRTGDARRNLHAWAAATAATATLYVAHGVSYGVFLELGHQGRFSILWPAIRVFQPLILKAVRDDLERAFGGQWVASV